MRSFFSLFLLVSASIYASDYGFIDPRHPWHLEGDFRSVAKAHFRHSSLPHSTLHYQEGAASLYYSQFLSSNNTVCYQIGDEYINLDWHENPRFRKNRYQNAFASLAFISTAMQRWRWIFKGGASVDASSFNFGQSGVYFGMFWGRYAYNQNLGFHGGFFGYGGIKNHYTLPIIGFDWHVSRLWKFVAIFPLKFSLELLINRLWTLSAGLTGFGGPYRYPRRAREGIAPYQDAIFEVYSKGAEIDLTYKQGHILRLGIGAGWNFGGWILIKNHKSEKGRYFKFNGAPYAQASLALTF